MLKIQKYVLWGILNRSCEFYDDNVTVTSFINIKYGDVATEIIP